MPENELKYRAQRGKIPILELPANQPKDPRRVPRLPAKAGAKRAAKAAAKTPVALLPRYAQSIVEKERAQRIKDIFQSAQSSLLKQDALRTTAELLQRQKAAAAKGAPKATSTLAQRALQGAKAIERVARAKAPQVGELAAKAARGVKAIPGAKTAVKIAKPFARGGPVGTAVLGGAELAYEGYKSVQALKGNEPHARGLRERGYDVARPALTVGDWAKMIVVPGYNAPASDPNQIQIKKKRKK